jgi:hypothetical protein
MENSFTPFEANMPPQTQKRNLDHTHIIKSNEVQLSSPIKITHHSNIPEPVLSQGKVEPLYNDGTVIGLRYHCHCGDVAEIIFEYDSDNSQQNRDLSE